MTAHDHRASRVGGDDPLHPPDHLGPEALRVGQVVAGNHRPPTGIPGGLEVLNGDVLHLTLVVLVDQWLDLDFEAQAGGQRGDGQTGPGLGAGVDGVDVLVNQPVGQRPSLPLPQGGQHRVGLDPGVTVVDGDGQGMADQQQFHGRAGP